MALKRIRLELARTADFPEGSPSHGYEFVAPLDLQGPSQFVGMAAGQGRLHRAALLEPSSPTSTAP